MVIREFTTSMYCVGPIAPVESDGVTLIVSATLMPSQFSEPWTNVAGCVLRGCGGLPPGQGVGIEREEGVVGGPGRRRRWGVYSRKDAEVRAASGCSAADRTRDRQHDRGSRRDGG